MSPLDWALRPLKHYADFRGRAPRAEYWWYVLAVTIAGALVRLVDAKLQRPIFGNYGPLGLTFAFALFMPGLAVTARRMHDTDRSGWWCLVKALGYVVSLTFNGRLARQLSAFSKPLFSIGVVALLIWICVAITYFVFLVTPAPRAQTATVPIHMARTISRKSSPEVAACGGRR